MKLDFIRLANDLRHAHAQGIPIRLPAMKLRDLDTLLALLSVDQPSSALVH